MNEEQKKQLSLSEREEEILEFWEKNKIFKKSIQQKKGGKKFVFYDGPPFATGLPHYGHILASTIKDVVPRYWAMKGFRVDRRWGWDCHGLPVENLVEQELNISGKKAIEKFGIRKFNETARSKVLTYAAEWQKIVKRIGRFVDFENSYKTMDATYMESVWWAFSELHKKGLVYEDNRISLFCPRCETPLSNFEIAMDNSYRDQEDESVYVRFFLKDKKDECFLIWTTTPWTLPGNTAIAVNPKIEYKKYKIGEEYVWSAAPPPNKQGEEPAVIEKRLGKSLLGLKYNPPFRLTNDENAYRVVPADFVNIEEGTGFVHIAPAFGEEDFELGKKENLPTLNTLDEEGRFNRRFSDVGFIGGEKTNEANSLIIKYLEKGGYLWGTKKIVHRYPICWRCQTPLIYKVQPAWFIKISGLKKKMIALNEKIDWHPEFLKRGRFKKGLEAAPDWNVSRSRFWGTPLPIWRCQCGNYSVVGSIEELSKRADKSGNKYFLIRHGLAETNVLGVSNSWPEKKLYHLVEKGRKQVELAANKLKKENIDMIISSDMLRAKETTAILADRLGVKNIIYDERLRDLNVGELNGKSTSEHDRLFKNTEEKFTKSFPGGESRNDLKKRMTDFIQDIDKKYQNKNILIVGHGDPLWILEAISNNLSNKQLLKSHYIGNAEVRKIKRQTFPRNDYGEIDLHRPYIDKIDILCGCGGRMKRIPDVFDCWFESGSMPFAEKHYPFENKKIFEKNFPADFISEYIAQTRGWFYTLHVLSSALFSKPAFKHVVTTGNILSEKGEKLSKSRKNFPDPWILIRRFGVDAIRYYLMASSVMSADNINFSEKEVDEIYKKYSLITQNVLNFFQLSSHRLKKSDIAKKSLGKNILDRWIMSRLHSTIGEITSAYESYEIIYASRPLLDFIQDLSLWYVRRSRERIKSESPGAAEALKTLRDVLYNLSLIMAPVTPFLAEMLYQGVGMNKKQSVHLENWPKVNKNLVRKDIENNMFKARKISSEALRLRAEAGIKVRQPLQELRIKSYELRNKKEFLDIIKDEINIKKIIFDKNIKDETELDTAITPELKEEGFLREIIRAVQDLRKKAGLTPKDRPKLLVEANSEGKNFIEKYAEKIKKETLLLKMELVERLPQGVISNNVKQDKIEINIAF